MYGSHENSDALCLRGKSATEPGRTRGNFFFILIYIFCKKQFSYTSIFFYIFIKLLLIFKNTMFGFYNEINKLIKLDYIYVLRKKNYLITFVNFICFCRIFV